MRAAMHHAMSHAQHVGAAIPGPQPGSDDLQRVSTIPHRAFGLLVDENLAVVILGR